MLQLIAEINTTKSLNRTDNIKLNARQVCPVRSLTPLVKTQSVKVKSPDIYIPPQTGKPEQQWFTIRRGKLASISSRQRSAISGRPLPTEFGHAVCS